MKRLVVILIVCLSSLLNVSLSANQFAIPPEGNMTRGHTLKINKYLCVGTPYQRSVVHYCKTVLRRNKPTIFNVSVTVPGVLNYVLVSVKLHYKFKTYQPFLIDLEQEGCEYVRNRPTMPLTDYVYDIFQRSAPQLASPCPHGNRTYTLAWYLDAQYTPKSVPAGDYRLDEKFIDKDGVILFAIEVYFTVRRSGVLPSMLEWAHTIKMNKYLCVGMPYTRSTLHHCKTILRRNQATVINVSLSVPEVLNVILVTVKLYYKFKTYQPFLINMEQEGCEYVRNRPIIPLTDYIYDIFQKTVHQLSSPCPHGNRTYDIVWWLEEQYTPKSIPAGDYRLDIQFIAYDKVVIFAVEAYGSVRRRGVLSSMLEW